MEEIRRRLMQNDSRYLGVTPAPRAPPRPQPTISVGSTDSEASARGSGKARANAIVVSSEDEDEEPPQRIPPKPSSSKPPLRAADQNTIPMRKPVLKPAVLDHPSSFPAPIEQNRLKALGLGETIAVPDFRDDYAFMNSEETEKALRDLVGSSMNEDHQAEVNMEEATVEEFREGILLLAHQVIGRKWMRDREDTTKKCAGGILADDMGLGKTIQTLTRIAEGKRTREERDDGWSSSTLVICPLALVGQWASEIEKMTKLRVLKHQGTSRTTDSSVLKRYDVVVTTYDTVQSEHGVYTPPIKDASATSKKKKATNPDSDSESDIEDTMAKIKAKRTSKTAAKKKCALYDVKWYRVVLDEAHNIKNVKTKRAVACCDLDSKFRWCLTGTPMQNNVAELYSLIKFLRIKPYSDWSKFNEQIAKPISNGRGAGTAMKRLQVILKNIMLRRRKEDTVNGKKLIELPARTVTVLPCTFDSSEMAFYTALEAKMGIALDKLMEKGDANKNYMSVLLLLLRLRQACNHPLLVSKDYKKDAEAVEPTAAKPKADGDIDGDDLVAAFGALGVTRKCQVCTTSIDDSTAGEGEWRNHCRDCIDIAKQARQAEIDMPPSAKIRMILTLLNKIDQESDGEEKTIVFSQFTSMLDLIEPFLKANGIKYTRYDGSMQSKDREAALEKIRSSKSTRVILISFKAGSTGLNLTACNNVILVDLWWNPALEEQAFDRAHRYGQKRDVNIYKLKIDGTVEDRILELQEKKRVLAAAALSGDKIKNMRLGMEDLLALFRPGHRDADDSDDE